jgi:hypothetical protein
MIWTALAVTLAAGPALPQAGVQLVKVDLSVVAKGYRMSKLIGSNVINDKNEKIGTVDDIPTWSAQWWRRIREWAGAGGTRNIGGTNHSLVELECELASLHGARRPPWFLPPAMFSNQTGIATIAKLLPDCLARPHRTDQS